MDKNCRKCKYYVNYPNRILESYFDVNKAGMNWFGFLTVNLNELILDLQDLCSSQVAQRLKRLPAMRETWVRPLSWEDPLEKEMATHSSIAWRIPWTEEPGGV